MDTTVIHFAKFLGRKILHENREYILQSVSLDHLTVLNGSEQPMPKAIEECRAICNSENDVFVYDIPCSIAVLRTAEGFVSFEKNKPKSDDDKEIEIINAICNCAGITIEELHDNYKCQKRNLVQARQIHMTLRSLVLNSNETNARTAAIYHKDHATYLNAKRRVFNALDGYDIAFRERFRDVFLLIRSLYPVKAPKKLNLDWL